MSEKNGRRWIYLIVGVAGLLFAGVIYSWSIMKVPLNEELGISESALATVYTMSMIFFCAGSMLAGYLAKRMPSRFLLEAGGILMLAGFALTSRLSGPDIVPVYLFYGIIAGLGIGIVYNVLIAMVTAWFPDMRGLCSGILMMGFGASTLLIGSIASRLFEDASIGWSRVYLLLGWGCFIVISLCAIILRKPGPEGDKKDFRQEAEGATAAETLKDRSFWMFYLYGAIGAAVGSTIISFARDMAIDAGAGASLAAGMVGMLSISNGLGRVLSGFLYDRIGGKRTAVWIALLTILTPVLLLFASSIGSIALTAVGFIIAGISFGSYPTASASFISDRYGRKDFSINYSVSNSKMLFSSLAASAAGFLVEAFGSYRPVLVLFLGMGAVSILLSFTIRFEQKY